MPLAPTPALKPLFSPLDPQGRTLSWQVVAVLLGTLVLALSSYVEVPMVPVPITMQTFAVALVGALYGWRLGGVTITAWLLEGALGLPVLAGGAAGVHHFAGPTAGYLFVFPLAGALVGWLAERGWNGHRVALAFAAMLLSHALCLATGALWLALAIGPGQAIALGVTPFLIGAVLKSGLGAVVLGLLAQGRRRTGA
jgi:biotin transport system substrate-specific component